MAKQIIFGEEARKGLEVGVNKLADTVFFHQNGVRLPTNIWGKI
jgi:hypothetical protein